MPSSNMIFGGGSGGASIKQSYHFSKVSGSTTATFTFDSPVDVNKSVVLAYKTASGGSADSSTLTGFTLTENDLTITTKSSSATMDVYVIEFDGNVKVQKGVQSKSYSGENAGEMAMTYTEVDVTKSLFVTSPYSDNNTVHVGTTRVTSTAGYVYFQNRKTSSYTVYCLWNMITFED